MNRKRVFVVALAVVATLATGAGAVVMAEIGPGGQPAPDQYVSPAPHPRDVPETEPAGAAVQANEIVAALAILRRAPSTADAVPANVASMKLFADGAVALGLARKVRGAPRPTWIAPSSNGEAICYFSPGALSCPAAEELADKGAAIGAVWHANTPVRVTGVVSDGIRSVVVVSRGGSKHAVDAADNYIEFESEQMPQAVYWNGPRGPETLSFPDIAR